MFARDDFVKSPTLHHLNCNGRCFLSSSSRSDKEQLIQEDMKRLHGMGYAQELYRAMGGFSNFAISFTIISILSGCLTVFSFGINSAGPVAASLGWPLVSLFTLFVALAMAELASAF